MESKEITSLATLKVGDLVTNPPYSWGADDVLLVVDIKDNVGGEPMVTVLYNGELLEFMPWKLRKVQ